MNFMNKSWLKTRPRKLQKAASKQQIWKGGQIKFDGKIRSSQFLAEKVVYHIILLAAGG